MRIRRKPWARPELEACPFYVAQPGENRGRWRQQFARPDAPLHLELGCGKGGFISQLAPQHPEINYLAIDIKSEMLGLCKRKAEAAYAAAGRPVDNLYIFAQNIELLPQVLAPEDRVERIYINFCNPWPKAKHQKRRLTHPRQLQNYRALLAPGGEIWFKTDDDLLFADTMVYFDEGGWRVLYATTDLHAQQLPDNIVTEHEQMFVEMGKTIKFCKAALDG